MMHCCFDILPYSLRLCMGLCLRRNVTEEGKMAKQKSSQIELDLAKQAETETHVVKILLLGTAESGKSTLIKQIKIIHSNGFSKQELLSFKPAVFDNLFMSMKIVLRGMGTLRINLANKTNQVHARSILSCSQCVGEDQELLPVVAHAFCALWSDHGVRTAAARGYEFELNDSAVYFFESLSRIISPNYIPSESDVLRVRVRTSGIMETQFKVQDYVFRFHPPEATFDCCVLSLQFDFLCNKSFRNSSSVSGVQLKRLLDVCDRLSAGDMFIGADANCHFSQHGDNFISRLYDVGAQRSGRKKWLNCFDCIDAIVFVVALNGYDGTHTQEITKLQESLELFTSICNNGIFTNTSLILFMNKTDLFREKILNSGRHLKLYLPSFSGADCDVDAAANYITSMFSSLNTNPKKPVYYHYTTATDSDTMRVVFQMLSEQILMVNVAATRVQ